MSKQDYRTPPDLFRSLWEEFGFTVDAAASENNALVRPHRDGCPKTVTYGAGQWCPSCNVYVGHYWTVADDALKQDWSREVVFCNPPYAHLTPWVRKACEAQRQGALIVLLLPSATGTKWFTRLWDRKLQRPREGIEVRFLEGRIKFCGDDGHELVNPRYDNLIVVLHPL